MNQVRIRQVHSRLQKICCFICASLVSCRTQSFHQIAFAALSCLQTRAIMKPEPNSLVRSVLPTDCRDPVSLWRFANWCCQYLTRWSCPTNTSCATPVFMAIVFSNKIGQHNDIRLWLAFEYADRTVADDCYSLHTPAEPVSAADDLLLLGLEV